jgi:hypothetical protein
VAPSIADQHAGDADEGEEVLGLALVAAMESAAAGEPRQGAFNHPVVPTRPVGGIDAAASDARHDLPPPQPGAQVLEVVAVVYPASHQKMLTRRDHSA